MLLDNFKCLFKNILERHLSDAWIQHKSVNECVITIPTEEIRSKIFDALAEDVGIDLSRTSHWALVKIMQACPIETEIDLNEIAELMWMVFFGDYYSPNHEKH